MSDSFKDSQADRKQNKENRKNPLEPGSPQPTEENSASNLAEELAAVEASLSLPDRPAKSNDAAPHLQASSPLSMVETAFLASTASLLWLVSYYLSIGPWMRILFPLPIALVYLRWGVRSAWMSAIVSGLLLSVLMGPYLSLLFFVPYGFLGVQLGAMWKRRSPWFPSIGIGTLISTFGFFFRVWLLSIFLGEDLWSYLTNRMTDLLQLILSRLVDWGWIGLEVLAQTNLTVVQIVTVGAILLSDVVYIFTVHLAAWMLLDRVGNPIPEPPEWVQVLLEEEG
ncbi:DUF2232 domain-containing protein [filamentous cyanobacterium CCP1]|nr:DUF2232 domain-containing protein [filamentous cyanobacterium CCP2]PSB67037.1 DUF2232 domain-containing protein [filamentous cyanobacterium CCP1]